MSLTVNLNLNIRVGNEILETVENSNSKHSNEFFGISKVFLVKKVELENVQTNFL